MFTVHIKTESDIFQIEYGSPVLLSRVLADAGLASPMPCGGRGTCGKCRLRAAGALSPVSPEELLHLTEQERAEGIRLACRSYATGDCTIYFSIDRGRIQGVTEGSMARLTPDPGQDGYGAAVDIGTTTIAAYLYSLRTGVCKKAVCRENVQTAYGADVIARY